MNNTIITPTSPNSTNTQNFGPILTKTEAKSKKLPKSCYVMPVVYALVLFSLCKMQNLFDFNYIEFPWGYIKLIAVIVLGIEFIVLNYWHAKSDTERRAKISHANSCFYVGLPAFFSSYIFLYITMILYSFMHPKNPNDGILEIFGNIGDMVFFSFVLTNFLVVLFLIPLKNFVFYKSLKKHGIRYDKELYKQIQINTLPLYGCIFFFLAYIEGSKSVKLSDFGFAFTTIIAVYVLEFICSRIMLKKSQSRRF